MDFWTVVGAMIISILEEDADDDDDKSHSQSSILDISESTVVNVSKYMDKTEEDLNEKGHWTTRS